MISFYLALIDEPADQELFIEFYGQYQKQMLFVAKETMKDEHLAEDAVQDALTRIARNIKTIRVLNDAQKRKYALTAAKNAALDIIKKQNKLDSVLIESEQSIEDRKIINEFEDRENVDYAVSVIQHLPQKYRDAMYLRFVLDMSEKQVADILNIKVNTLRQHIYRGKKMFAEMYNKESYNDENGKP